MKTLPLPLMLLSTVLFIGCANNQQSVKKEVKSFPTTRSANTYRVEVCQNCHVNFKTSLASQKLAIDNHTHGLCSKCARKYLEKQHNN